MVGDLFIENEAQHTQRKRAQSRSGKNTSKTKSKRTVGQEVMKCRLAFLRKLNQNKVEN